MALSSTLMRDLPGLLSKPAVVLAHLAKAPQPQSSDELWGVLSTHFRDELVSVASAPACPEDFVEWCLRQGAWEDANAALARNAALPIENRRLAFCRTNPALAGSNWVPELGDDFKRLLCRAGLDLEGDERDPTLTASELEALHALGGMATTLALAHPACPVALLLKGVRGSPAEREAAALNRNLPLACVEDLLGRFGDDQAVLVRLAQHPLIPEKVALTWATKPVKGAEPLRRFLSRNPAVSEKVLAVLAKSPVIELRVNVASNPGTPAKVLSALAKDASPGVRKAALAAMTPKTAPPKTAMAKPKTAKPKTAKPKKTPKKR